jgi:alkyldihydroxyacetonephosphate synthase
MAAKVLPRQSIWMFGLESDEPSETERRTYAKGLSESLGVEVELPPIPSVEALQLREPRIKPPESLAEFCRMDNYERALHSKGDLWVPNNRIR